MNKSNYIGHRPTWAEVKLANITHNFNQIKKLLAPHVKIMVTVKADAYGHGIIPVSKRLVACGADYLGVASIDEGIKLRQCNINLPILVLGIALEKDARALFRYKLIPTLCSDDLALILNKMAAKANQPITVHIKVDTGMSRIGVLYKDAFSFIRRVHRLKFINIEGLFTHLACADINRDYTLRQIDLFNRLILQLNKEGIHIPLVHAANSMGVLSYKSSHFNMVRPGLIIYGLYPKKGLKINLKPALGLKTKIVYYKKLPKGQGISYGHTYVTKKYTTVVTLPIGYGDGYPRNLSNSAPVLIKGRRFKISGRVCMDQVMVDVGDLKVKLGDEVVLIGSQGKNKITTEELARLSGTIPYEIVCGLGSRIPRVYI
jgi:alanine racemase